ncbi:MAG TPA: hypothetical protein VLZ31_00260, partial [Microbacteriaceae bacterium]|nr:hypothetical protein [Microbacteriaceae bacterium]
MVARFSRFRITYLISFLTGKPKTFFKHVAVLLFSATVAIFIAWLPTVLSSDNLENLYILDVLVGSVSVSLIVAIPFFISRWNLDPRSLQSVPKPLANVAVGFLISAIFSWPFLGALTWVSAWVYFRKATLPVSAATIIVVLVTLTFMLVTTRFSASLTEILFNTDRKRKLRNLIAVVLLSVLTPIVINVFNSVSKPEDAEALNELVNFVEFTPAGLPFYTLQNISNGNTYEVIFGLSLSVMMLALVSGVTISLLIRQLRSVPRPDDSSFTTLRLGWFEVLPATPTGAIGARSIIYWLKDPRYRVSLLAIPIIPFSVVAILKFAGVSTAFLSFVPLPLVLIMVAWMLHN